MEKIIRIKTCKDCPWGSRGRPDACYKQGKARTSDIIPDWCPLENDNKEDSK